MPKSVVTNLPELGVPLRPIFRPGGIIYEVPVRAFTMRHPELPEKLRGTVAALAHPTIIAHLTSLGIDAVELMPITAWIDERHLSKLGLRNAWGYNPVVYMAPDPRICPGGISELRATVARLREAGIGTILDVVFNHTGEGDADGPVLSLRGLDNRAYFRHDSDQQLTNESGCGNTLACDHPAARRLVLDSLRHFVVSTGVDGFRFDLAPVLGRTPEGFNPRADLLSEILQDPLLGDRVLIAEPWDIGEHGYQLGSFPAPFLEWNDHYRDRVRRYWRGNSHSLGPFATALAGSSDLYAPHACRAVNFIAAHDGFALADLVSYAHKHNLANGEHNRDGHSTNHSWNNGVEGESNDPAVTSARDQDVKALLATLYFSRGTIMLTAGDEFGRSQRGNNNAYAQDNPTTWLDWENRDRALEQLCAELSRVRRAHPSISDPALRIGRAAADGVPELIWLSLQGTELTRDDWHQHPCQPFAMILGGADGGRIAVLFNSERTKVRFNLFARPGWSWPGGEWHHLDGRAVHLIVEQPPP